MKEIKELTEILEIIEILEKVEKYLEANNINNNETKEIIDNLNYVGSILKIEALKDMKLSHLDDDIKLKLKLKENIRKLINKCKTYRDEIYSLYNI